MPLFRNYQPQPPTFSEPAAKRLHRRAQARQNRQAPPSAARRLKAQIRASSTSSINEITLEIRSVGRDVVRLGLDAASRVIASLFGLSQDNRRADTRNPLLEDDRAAHIDRRPSQSSKTLW